MQQFCKSLDSGIHGFLLSPFTCSWQGKKDVLEIKVNLKFPLLLP